MGVLTLRVRHAAALIAALAAAAPAAAQMYKWVDERGATTYSNTPPTVGKLPKKVDAVAERVSVYTPDASLTRAMEIDPQRDARIANLEHQLASERRQLDAERSTRRIPDAGPRQGAYERCLAERRVDCERLHAGADGYAEAIPYYVPVYVFGAAQRSRHPHPAAHGYKFEELRIGVDNRPPVGIDNRPPVGMSTRSR